MIFLFSMKRRWKQFCVRALEQMLVAGLSKQLMPFSPFSTPSNDTSRKENRRRNRMTGFAFGKIADFSWFFCRNSNSRSRCCHASLRSRSTVESCFWSWLRRNAIAWLGLSDGWQYFCYFDFYGLVIHKFLNLLEETWKSTSPVSFMVANFTNNPQVSFPQTWFISFHFQSAKFKNFLF